MTPARYHRTFQETFTSKLDTDRVITDCMQRRLLGLAGITAGAHMLQGLAMEKSAGIPRILMVEPLIQGAEPDIDKILLIKKVDPVTDIHLLPLIEVHHPEIMAP